MRRSPTVASTGVSFESLALVGVSDQAGVALVAPADGTVTDEVPITGGTTGLALTSDLDAPRLYVATGSTLTVLKLNADGVAHAEPAVESTIAMPGPVTKVTFDDASIMVHALGTTPDGQNTIYASSPRGSPPANSVFADARLPFAPVAWATDVQPDYPTTDRQTILAFDADGAVASVDIGMHEFSWRVPGVIAGALTAGLLFLLTRLLFRRRSIGVLVAIMALADGMLFVQSRIAMNDVYVGLVHRRRVRLVRRPVDRPLAVPGRVRRPDAGRSACCSASPWPASGSPRTRSRRWACSSSSARRSAGC